MAAKEIVDELCEKITSDNPVLMEEPRYLSALAALKFESEIQFDSMLRKLAEKVKVKKSIINEAVNRYIDKSSKMDDREIEETDPSILKFADCFMNDDPVELIMETYNRYHVGDTNLGMIMLLSIANQSIINSEGIQPKLSGTSGKGKTHAAKTMYGLLPEGWKIEGSLSAKTLFHSPDLRAGTVVFSDDVRINLDLEDTLKRTMSNFQEKTTHRSLDGNKQYEELEIPERICWWMTSVNSDYSDELLNRLFDISVDESSKTDKAVTEQQLKDAESGNYSLPDGDDIAVKVCREIIRRIKKQLFKVKIPFAKRIEWHGSNDRRNLPRFLDLIKGFTVLRYMQRQEESDGVYLADLKDYEDAVALLCSNEESLSTKLTGAELRFVKWAAGKGEMTINDVVSSYQKENGDQYTYEAIRKMVFGANRRPGLLSKVPGMKEMPITRITGKGSRVSITEKGFMVPPPSQLTGTNTLVSLKEEIDEMEAESCN